MTFDDAAPPNDIPPADAPPPPPVEVVADVAAGAPRPHPVEATADVAAGVTIDSEVRRRLVERFEWWLDRMAAGEPPPAGIPAELFTDLQSAPAGSDLYGVVTGLTGLTGEVRLQGRAFKQLADVLAPLAELPAQFEQLSASLEPAEPAEPAEDSAVSLPSPKTMLEVLLDLHDRLARGLRNAEAAVVPNAPGWFDRMLGRTTPEDPSAAAAMRDGYALTLSRLTAALHQWDVEPIGEAGEPFDPRRMVAIDVRAGTAQPAGAVVEVNRSGCTVRGTVMTPAQVTVAK